VYDRSANRVYRVVAWNKMHVHRRNETQTSMVRRERAQRSSSIRSIVRDSASHSLHRKEAAVLTGLRVEVIKSLEPRSAVLYDLETSKKNSR